LAVVLAAWCGGAWAGDNRNHKAILSGDGEVPPRDTQARGVAIFHISKDELSIDYILIAANIHNVVGAHIHTGQPGVNGPIVVPLMDAAAPGGGRFQGILGAGTITAANLTGPLAGQPLSVLIAEIKSGNTYVNVHTNDGVAPTNTGPGDFPGGEIRGPIR
jgi:hypothetical protein